jgi:hypothetical protein
MVGLCGETRVIIHAEYGHVSVSLSLTLSSGFARAIRYSIRYEITRHSRQDVSTRVQSYAVQMEDVSTRVQSYVELARTVYMHRIRPYIW